MLRADDMRIAVDEIVAAALLGERWEAALSAFSQAAGAHGAVVMRNRNYRVVAGVFTPSIAEAVAEVFAGRAPVVSRQVRASHGLNVGFRIDHDDYTAAQLDHDPYYQDFLRPRGFFWHANVRLASSRDEWVSLSLKRRLDAGPYERQDAVMLDSVLPSLRAAARLAKRTLDAETRSISRFLQRRGDPVYQLDVWGRVIGVQAGAEPSPADPVQVVHQRLVAASPRAQPALDRAVGKAATPPGALAIVPLAGHDGRRYFLQFVPVPGQARDVFRAAAAVAVLIDAGAPPVHPRLDAVTLTDIFALTDREADVAALLAEGLTLTDIARHLCIQVGTARSHLKSIFEKTGTNRQAELVALLGRLRP